MNNLLHALGREIETRKVEFANLTVNELWLRHPQFAERYRAAGRAKCEQDIAYTAAYLSEAIALNSPPLFQDYIDWVSVLFTSLKIPLDHLMESLEILRGILQKSFPGEPSQIVASFVDSGISRMQGDGPGTVRECISEPTALKPLAIGYLYALRQGDRHRASRMVMESLDQGASVIDIYLNVFQATQNEIGRLWQTGQMSVAEEHFCTASTQIIMSQLYPRIFQSEKIGRSMVATAVSGELHEIGLRMVSDIFEMKGWDTYYVGSGVPAGSIVKALIDRNASLLAISATMTFHMKAVETLIAQVRLLDVESRTTILVGGYPFNKDRELWKKVGADGYAPDAESAVALADALAAA